MPKKPGETSWNSDEDDDLLSDYKQESDSHDVDIDENILELSDTENIELMPPEPHSVQQENQDGDVTESGPVTEDCGEMTEQNQHELDYEDDEEEHDGFNDDEGAHDGFPDGEDEQEVLEDEIDDDGLQYDADDNEMEAQEYILYDEDGNAEIVQIVPEIQEGAELLKGDYQEADEFHEGAELCEREESQEAEHPADMEGEMIAVIRTTNHSKSGANNSIGGRSVAGEMESDAGALVPRYDTEDEDEAETRERRDRFATERSTESIATVPSTVKRDIPDSLSISQEEKDKISRFLNPRDRRGPANMSDQGRPQTEPSIFQGVSIRPLQQHNQPRVYFTGPQRTGRKILINPHFKPRYASSQSIIALDRMAQAVSSSQIRRVGPSVPVTSWVMSSQSAPSLFSAAGGPQMYAPNQSSSQTIHSTPHMGQPMQAYRPAMQSVGQPLVQAPIRPLMQGPPQVLVQGPPNQTFRHPQPFLGQPLRQQMPQQPAGFGPAQQQQFGPPRQFFQGPPQQAQMYRPPQPQQQFQHQHQQQQHQFQQHQLQQVGRPVMMNQVMSQRPLHLQQPPQQQLGPRPLQNAPIRPVDILGRSFQQAGPFRPETQQPGPFQDPQRGQFNGAGQGQGQGPFNGPLQRPFNGPAPNRVTNQQNHYNQRPMGPRAVVRIQQQMVQGAPLIGRGGARASAPVMVQSSRSANVVMRNMGPGPGGQQRVFVQQRQQTQIMPQPRARAIQTLVGGSTCTVGHSSVKRIATVVTAAPPAKLIKLDARPAANESEYHKRLEEQKNLRAMIQQQKELRRQQMSAQRIQAAEQRLAETGLSIETVLTCGGSSSSHVNPGAHAGGKHSDLNNTRLQSAPLGSTNVYPSSVQASGPGLVRGQQPRPIGTVPIRPRGVQLSGQGLVQGQPRSRVVHSAPGLVHVRVQTPNAQPATPAAQLLGPGLVRGDRPQMGPAGATHQQAHMSGSRFQSSVQSASGVVANTQIVQRVAVASVQSAGRVVSYRQVTTMTSQNRTVLAPASMGVSNVSRVTIENISPSTTYDRLEKLCESIGKTQTVVYLESQGKAVVDFLYPWDAVQFVNRFNRQMLDSSTLHVTLG